jgi:hypothetical protein
MRRATKLAVIVSACCGLAVIGWAQRGRMGMGQAPQIAGVFKPEVGAGAQYQITEKGQTTSWVYAVVGKENVSGSEGYWVEMRGESGEAAGTIMKILTVSQDGKGQAKRVIVQSPGQPPMELPAMMMAMGQRGATQEAALGEKIGSESVTVPAGTFTCDHYRSKKGEEVTDHWITAQVPPYGLVKSASPHGATVLVKVLTNETSKIKGEPQKMNFPMMPGGGPQE